ncbi:MAG: lipopolysaccharide transport system ATP-binding protein [Bacteroidia bacterium]|jgi:lipopolysaccharide transport system ATP-binding protein
MMSDVAISVEGISKKYVIGHQVATSLSERVKSLLGQKPKGSQEEFWALRDVSFEIKRGEAVGIIGKNGAGKSTLLKILSRITYPTAGRFEMNGRVSSLLEVGTGFHPELSGRENIFLNGTILGMSRREVKEKFDEIVAFSGVSKFLDTPVKHYSSGMYVRLAFAVAAHLEPEILIIDEVLAVGDAEFQKKCLGKMNEVAKQGRTVIFVSHNMGAISKLCSQSILISKGEVESIGETKKVIDQYNEAKSEMPAEIKMSNKEAYIRSVSLVSSDFVALQQAFHNDEIKIKLDVVIDPNYVQEGIVALTLLNQYKNPVFTIHKYFEDIIRAQQSHYSLLYTLPANTLTPQEYSFTVKLHSYYEDFDFLSDISSFAIIDAGSKYAKWQDVDYGCVFMDQAKFEVIVSD